MLSKGSPQPRGLVRYLAWPSPGDLGHYAILRISFRVRSSVDRGAGDAKKDIGGAWDGMRWERGTLQYQGEKGRGGEGTWRGRGYPAAVSCVCTRYACCRLQLDSTRLARAESVHKIDRHTLCNLDYSMLRFHA